MRKKKEALDSLSEENVLKIIWMSFCGPSGNQFMDVKSKFHPWIYAITDIFFQ